jgi:hypothetical protein
MSALPPKADIEARGQHGRYGPIADMTHAHRLQMGRDTVGPATMVQARRFRVTSTD